MVAYSIVSANEWWGKQQRCLIASIFLRNGFGGKSGARLYFKQIITGEKNKIN